MKIKIEMLDPAGGVVESEEFESKFKVEKVDDSRKVNIDGNEIVLPKSYEPMKKFRTLLTIGENRFYLNSDGSLIELNPKPIKLYFVHRPKMKGTKIPTFYYCYADSPEDAIKKVSLKWGEYDKYSTARELRVEECDKLVIGLDNYFG